MKSLIHLIFKSDFPDDAVWDGNGIPLKPGGENITISINMALKDRGLVCSEVLQRSVYGWEFSFSEQENSYFCVVQAYEENKWLLICKMQPNLWNTFFSKNKVSDKSGFKTLENVMTSSSHFTNIKITYPKNK